MNNPFVTLELSGSIARVTLDRTDLRNAFNDTVIEEFIAAWKEIASRGDIRVVLLESKGEIFSAGADLAWMKEAGSRGDAANRADAERLFDCMMGLDSIPVPTICRVQGPAFGGALGLMACCDIVIAAREASFAFSEVRIGLAPAVISPFVARKVSRPHLQDLFLTGRRFSAEEAGNAGLVTQVVPGAELDAAVEKTIHRLLSGSPQAQRKIKALVRRLPFDSLDEMREITTRLIAGLRGSDEGVEGMSAFLERRKPKWQI